MAISIVLPQTRGKDASVKDLIVSILVKEGSLTTRKIYHRIARIYALSCSYQAVHKSVKKLVKDGVLIEKNREYSINLEWLEQIKKFSEEIKQEYSSKQPFEASESNLSFYSRYLDNYQQQLLPTLKAKIKGMPYLYCSKLELSENGNRLEKPVGKKIYQIATETNESFILLGQAGAGKTTALYQIASKYCKTGNKIPIIYNLTGFVGQKLSDIVCQKVFETTGERINAEFGEEALKKGVFVFLFDGLNEISGNTEINGENTDRFEVVIDRLNQFASDKKYSKNKYIIACRNNSDPKEKLPLPAFSLKPFTEKQMKKYLNRRNIPGLFTELKKLGSVFELCTNPLLLDMTINVYTAQNSLPKSKTELYDHYFSNLIYGWESKTIKKPELIATDLDEALSKFAFKMIPVGTIVPMKFFLENLRKICKELEIEKKDERKLIETILKTNLIQIDGINCKFAHHSFQEFFAAKELSQRFDGEKNIDAELIQTLANNRSYFDTLIFLSGLLEDSTNLIKILHEKNLFVAGECAINAKKINQNTLDEIIMELLQLVNDPDNNIHWRAADILNRTGERACELAIQEIKNGKNTDLKRRLLWVTGHFNNKKIEKILIENLQDPDQHNVIHTLLGLQDLDAYKDIAPIIPLLSHQNPIIKGEAAITIERKSAEPENAKIPQNNLNKLKEETINDLVELLKDKDYWVRMHSALTLGKMNSKQAINPLINSLSDENFSVRWHAILALSKIGDKEIAEILGQKINDAAPKEKELLTKAINAIKNKVEDRKDLVKIWNQIEEKNEPK